MKTSSPRLGRWFAPAVLLLASLAFHGRQLAGERPYWRDVHLAFAPVKHSLAALLSTGQLPEWWPYSGGGMPLLAQPTFSVLHPTSLAYAVLPFWTAFAFQDLAGTMLAAFGAWLLARRLRLARPAALLAGVLYAFNGYVASLTEFSSAKLAAGTLPWYCWALLVARERGGAALALPGLVMGLLLLAGEPQIALLAAGCGFALVFARPPPTARAVLLGVVSPAVGGLLAAAQLLPSLRLAGVTERASTELNAGQWPLTARHLAGLVLPLDLGPFEFAASTAFGLAAVTLVFASLVAVRRLRWVAVVWVVTLLSVGIAAGEGFGLHELARAVVPLWKQFRYPVKSFLVASLGLSLLAAAGWTQLAGPRRKQALRAGLAGAAAALGLVLLVTPLPAATTGVGLLVPLVALAVVPGRLSTARRWGPALLLSTQVVATAVPLLRTTDAAFYEPSPTARTLLAAGVSLEGPYFERLDATPWPPEEVAFATAAGAGGKASDYGGFHGLPVLSIYLPAGSGRVRQFFAQHAGQARLAGALGVGFLVLRDPVPPHLAGQVIGRDPQWGYAVVKLRQTLPRAYAVHRARLAPDATSAMAAFAGPGFKPGREVILEDAPVRAETEARPDTPAVPATFVSRTNNSVVLDVELPWDGFVVLNEAWFPGWTARVDDAPRAVHPANGLMRAVEVPAGRHRVAFVYRTPGLDEGLAVSAASALALGLLALLLQLRGRRTARPGGSRDPSDQGSSR